MSEEYDLDSGTVLNAYRAFLPRGAVIHVGKSRDETVNSLIQTWAKLPSKEPEHVRILASSSDLSLLNRRARWARIGTGDLPLEKFARLGDNYFIVGEPVVFAKGDTGRVSAQHPFRKKSALIIERTGHKSLLDSKHFIATSRTKISLDYASSDCARRSDKVFALVSATSSPDFGLAQLTAHKRACGIYMDRETANLKWTEFRDKSLIYELSTPDRKYALKSANEQSKEQRRGL